MDRWSGFFSTIAGVAAALLAVAFITFQLKIDVWRGGGRLRHLAAVFTLWELSAPLLIALILAMPAHPWRVAAILTGAIGLAVLITHWALYAGTAESDRSPFDQKQFRLSFISLVTFGGMAGSGLMYEQPGMYLLASLSIWSLISGTYEAWIYLEP
ncbi:hypothetical protein [Streptomyces canus]|uniref:hypothetical protein n=1 Tax=Streptomyces canus TaxID=58343 RepID=UPI002E28A4F0|nr:hypothetical protein [Streptomyces canus]